MDTNFGRSFGEWLRDQMRLVDHDSLAPYRARILLAMGAVAIALLAPFTVNHLIQERWGVALALFTIMLLTYVNVRAVAQRRSPPIPSAWLLLPFVAGITMSVVVQGVPGILWAYPVVVYAYFVLTRRIALFSSIAILGYVASLAAAMIDVPLALRLFATLLLTIIMINIVLNVIADLHRKLENQALTDPLTGAYNRRFMEKVLDALVARAERQPLVACILMIDIDHFKRVNDRFGHDHGDLVLKRVVDIVASRMRRSDRLFRWGGEEFLVLLEGADLEGATRVAEDIRQSVAAATILPEQAVTVSIGVSQYQARQDVDGWTRAADVALYEAKSGGRNRVVQAKTVEPVAQ